MPHARSEIRLIAGRFKGRKLPVPRVDGLRPSGARQRERLFNWLQFDIAGARCLDMFAGTGALAFEALSRGAAFAWLIERDRRAMSAITQSIELLGVAEQSCLLKGDALRRLQQVSLADVDLVFLDPPFARSLWQASIDALAAGGLPKGARLYLEAPKQIEPLRLPPGWQIAREATDGQNQALLIECNAPTTAHGDQQHESG